jgi:hypothetical protein
MIKKFFLPLLAILILTGFSFSQSYLQLSLYDDEDFSVVFDNTELSAGNYAEFDNIPAGEHYLKVIKEGVNVPPTANVLFEGKIKIPSGFDIYAVIDEYNTFSIYKKKHYGFNRYAYNGDFMRRCGDQHSYKDNQQNYTDECRYKMMKKDDFKDLKSTINNMNFESTNLDLVKTAIDNNYFTSEQVRELLTYFTYEDNRLIVAKYAYKKVCDQKNFFKVYDAFNFESSVSELKNYISGK